MHDRLPELLKSAGLSNHEESVGASGPSGSGSVNGQDSASTRAILEATHAVMQLQAATQGSADSLAANTDALTKSATPHSSGNSASGIGDAASGLLSGSGLGGGLLGGGLSLLFDGIKSLFGGGRSEPPPLTTYVPPPTQAFDLAMSNGTTGSAVYDSYGQPREADVAQTAISSLPAGGVSGPSVNSNGGSSGQGANAAAPQITVHVQAMDSQSFMDRSGDIASAVREAMLNMHSINDVVNDL